MGNEYSTYSFAELLSNIVDNRGKTCPIDEDGLPLIATNCVKNDTLHPVFEKVRYVNKETYDTWFRGHPEPGDMIFVCKGAPGNVCWTPDPVDFCIAQDMVAIRANREIVDPKFLFAFLRSSKTQAEILNMHVGTMIPHFKKGDFKNLYFDIPDDKRAQKSIGEIYFSFSEKIEINRQMNATLESMAQALYKSWFVDFDPVIDNALAAGNPIPEPLHTHAETRKALGDKRKPLPEAIQKQFPRHFVFSEEMGWVPAGWEVLQLSKLINVKHGFAFKGEYFSDVPTDDILLTPGNFRVGGGFKADKFKYYKGPVTEEYVFDSSGLVLTMTDLSKAADTLGFPAFVPKTVGRRYLHNQRIGKVEVLHNKVGKEFLYRCFCSKSYRDEILSSYSGTTVKHTSPKKIMAHTIAIPGRQTGDDFEKLCTQFTYRINCNVEENYSLTKLRDTLLPKLLSGQLSIPDTQKLVADAI